MADLARDCFPEDTVVDHFNLFLKEYDTYTQQDHTRVNFLQNALERIIKQIIQEIVDVLTTLHSGLHNTWLLFTLWCGYVAYSSGIEIDESVQFSGFWKHCQ